MMTSLTEQPSEKDMRLAEVELQKSANDIQQILGLSSYIVGVKFIFHESENLQSGIRFFTMQGCCGPSLQLNVAHSPIEGDVVVKIGEVDMFVTPDAEEILSPLTIGFKDESFYSETKMKENA